MSRRQRDLTIPAEVLERLDDETRAAVCDERSTREGIVPVEHRTFDRIETRSNSDGTWDLRGYACVYDYGYPIAGGPENGGWTEIVARGAATKSINDAADVRLLFDHEGIPLARTKSGSLTLRSDDMGLRFDAPNLDPSSPYAQSVRSAVERGDADQCSFAFRVVNQSWNRDYTERTITEVALYDVSVVTYPASDATVVTMHSSTDTPELRRADVADFLTNLERRLDDSNVDAATVTKIQELIAELINDEVAETISEGEASDTLAFLISVLDGFTWFLTEDTEDETEPASQDPAEPDAPDMIAASAVLNLHLAKSQADALRSSASK